MSDELHRYTYDPLVHSDPGCQWRRCGRPSDGSLDGVAYCAEHADLVLERWVAVGIAPELADVLPTFDDF